MRFELKQYGVRDRLVGKPAMQRFAARERSELEQLVDGRAAKTKIEIGAGLAAHRGACLDIRPNVPKHGSRKNGRQICTRQLGDRHVSVARIGQPCELGGKRIKTAA